MANEQNLRPMKQTSEEARINGRKGGIASVKARREKKTFRELAEMIGSMQANEKTRTNVKKIVGIKDKEITYDMAIVVNNIMRASNGDPRASDWLASIRGEKIQKSEVTGADGTPLIPTRTLTAEEQAEIWQRLDKEV